MKSKKKIYIAAFTLALLLTAGGAGVIHAASIPGGAGRDPMNNLATLLAQRFNLNVTDVQKFFDEQRTKMETERKQQFVDRINQGVTDGKLTRDQADKIIAKHTELEALRDSLKNKTEAERQTAIKAQIEAVKKWAEENNIPSEFMLFGGPGMGKGSGHSKGHDDFMMRPNRNNIAPQK
jgi:outer membrane murein-binding lipoprotein Lpp